MEWVGCFPGELVWIELLSFVSVALVSVCILGNGRDEAVSPRYHLNHSFRDLVGTVKLMVTLMDFTEPFLCLPVSHHLAS